MSAKIGKLVNLLTEWLPLVLGTGLAFLATAAGASSALFVGKNVSTRVHQAFLGFAAGVMIAASVWSLLIPAMEMAQQEGMLAWLPAAAGFAAGGAFLSLLDRLLLRLRPEKHSLTGGTMMMVLAVTLHNIPEGMALGLAFSVAAQSGEAAGLAGAAALCAGMALQNFPEGAAVSLPLRREGAGRGKAFAYGVLSGTVEPLSAVAGALLAISVAQVMPFFLSFAAGAMIYVVVEELVPQAHGCRTHAGTAGIMAGFLLMMVLDLAFA